MFPPGQRVYGKCRKENFSRLNRVKTYWFEIYENRNPNFLYKCHKTFINNALLNKLQMLFQINLDNYIHLCAYIDSYSGYAIN